jgi:hypothetical protein
VVDSWTISNCRDRLDKFRVGHDFDERRAVVRERGGERGVEWAASLTRTPCAPQTRAYLAKRALVAREREARAARDDRLHSPFWQLVDLRDLVPDDLAATMSGMKASQLDNRSDRERKGRNE